MDIPQYKTLAGQFYPTCSLSKDDERVCVIKTTFEEVCDYQSSLQKLGFKQAYHNLFPSSIPNKANLGAGWFKENTYITIFWESSFQTARITISGKKNFPFDKATNGSCPLWLTQCAVGFGCSYVVGLKNGNFVLVDGGNSNQTDMQNLFKFLKDNAPNGKIVIDGWFFTHPDQDHITLANDFMQEYSSQVQINAFIYQFADFEKVEMLCDKQSVIKDVALFEDTIKTKYPNTKIYTAHTGQKYVFSGVTVDVLYSIDDTYPTIYPSPNEMSLALKLTFENNKTALLLGDCMNQACRQLAHTYGEYLKCDMMQLAHHGLIGGDTYLYKTVNPDVCFWDSNLQRFNGQRPTDKYQWCLGQGGCDYNEYIRNDQIKKRTHYTNSRFNTVKID